MTEFTGLRSKMYTIRVEGHDGVKKANGVKKHLVKNNIKFEDYVECLDFSEKTVCQKIMKIEKHNVYSENQTKIALSPHDDKRCLFWDI